jgi:hypothetical protein
MPRPHFLQISLWLALAFAVLGVIARGVWLYWASLTWPTADGIITRLEVERQQGSMANGGGGHYYRATFIYDFHLPNAQRLTGTWYKNFSSEPEAREFAARELPIGKPVVVRYNPKNPASNDLELDSWTYTGDRPTTLGNI